jgi:hypothetical protein
MSLVSDYQKLCCELKIIEQQGSARGQRSHS